MKFTEGQNVEAQMPLLNSAGHFVCSEGMVGKVTKVYDRQLEVAINGQTILCYRSEVRPTDRKTPDELW